MTIQWFPGHMAKAIREIKETRKQIDVALEILDARAPLSCRNPVVDEILEGKPRLLLLNKADLADPTVTKSWIASFKQQGLMAISVNAMRGKEAARIEAAAREAIAQSGKPVPAIVKAVVFGIPNVGKSSMINHLVGRKVAVAADKPGVTKKQSWLNVSKHFMLLDTPGILWPKFDDPKTGFQLAVINGIRQESYENEEIAFYLCQYLLDHYPNVIHKRFDIDREYSDPLYVFEAIGKRRGCFVSGNEVDFDRVYDVFLKEFRGGKIGALSIENVDNR